MAYQFERMDTREGFNTALGHFQSVADIMGSFDKKVNLADAINELLDSKDFEQDQILPTVHALLVDKYKYKYKSFNLPDSVESVADIQKEFQKWKGVDVCIVYMHPELGILFLNPKNPDHWSDIQILKKNELITIYAGMFAKEAKSGVLQDAVLKAADLLKGKKVKAGTALTKGSFSYKSKPVVKAPKAPKLQVARKAKASSSAPKQTTNAFGRPSAMATPSAAPAPVAVSPTTGKMQITPFYSVPVTNELFHNGNVEAWKKIIESYTTKYPAVKVFIYYEGEAIHDINTLFKWGKVKHGSSILIRLAGVELKDIGKLQKYLRQGASPRFEDFLRFPVNKILDLF